MNDLIEKLSNLRSQFNLFDENEREAYHTLSDAIKAISEQPEIIRCKDCKHRIEHKHYGDLGESAYTCEGNMGGWILPDGFCSLAEREANGN